MMKIQSLGLMILLSIFSSCNQQNETISNDSETNNQFNDSTRLITDDPEQENGDSIDYSIVLSIENSKIEEPGIHVIDLYKTTKVSFIVTRLSNQNTSFRTPEGIEFIEYDGIDKTDEFRSTLKLNSEGFIIRKEEMNEELNKSVRLKLTPGYVVFIRKEVIIDSGSEY